MNRHGMDGMDGKGFIRVYRIDADEPLKRKEIGQFKTEALSYQHSFIMTQDYVVV